MNRIRTAAATVAMLVGAATLATAQAPAPQHGQHGHDGKAKQGAHGMMGDLNLTDAQKEQIKAIHAKYRPQFQQLRASARPNMEAARTARQAGDTAAARAAMVRARTENTAAATALQQQQQAEIRAVLTAEQRVKFDARHAQMRERMAQRDSTQRKAGAREGKRGRRPMRGARPGQERRRN